MDYIEREKLHQILASYNGHLSYGNTKNLLYKRLDKYNGYYGDVGIEVRIVNNLYIL